MVRNLRESHLSNTLTNSAAPPASPAKFLMAKKKMRLSAAAIRIGYLAAFKKSVANV
jgi:hypothetical protein